MYHWRIVDPKLVSSKVGVNLNKNGGSSAAISFGKNLYLISYFSQCLCMSMSVCTCFKYTLI